MVAIERKFPMPGPEAAVLRNVTSIMREKDPAAQRSLVDASLAAFRCLWPSVNRDMKGKQYEVYEVEDYIAAGLSFLEDKAVKRSFGSKGLADFLQSGNPMVFTSWAQRGTGKTEITDNLANVVKTQDICQPVIMHTDSYFTKKGGKSKYGGNENSRNSAIKAMLNDIRGFKAGLPVALRTGKYGSGKHETAVASKTPLLIVEGIHAQLLDISREADVITAIVVDPAAQIIRAAARDLAKNEALDREPGYYIRLNLMAIDWWRWTTLHRLKDAHIVLSRGIDERDIRILARIPEDNGDKIKRTVTESEQRRLDAWMAWLRNRNSKQPENKDSDS